MNQEISGEMPFGSNILYPMGKAKALMTSMGRVDCG